MIRSPAPGSGFAMGGGVTLPPDSSAPRRRLLFVDDEPNVLDGLSKSLRTYRKQWDVVTAASGAAALELLSHGTFDALVTDARMPMMDGAQLLRVARERWPEMMRVVLSGETAKGGLADLTELAHHFIPKPVTMPVLHARLEEALAARQLLGSKTLKALVCRLGTLPSLPGTFAEVNSLLAQPKSTLEQFVRAIERDPSVCANVLRVVNSAWFGLRTRVASVREAVRLVGFAPLRDMVLAAEVFSGARPEVERLRHEALERLAALPKLISTLKATEWRESAATAVILADVGQLLLLLRSTPEAEAVDARVFAGHERVEAERRLLGADHAHLGAVLLSMWSLPAELSEAVALHHEVRSAEPVRSLSTLLALICAVQDLNTARDHRKEALAARTLQLAAAFGVTELPPLLATFTATQEAA